MSAMDSCSRGVCVCMHDPRAQTELGGRLSAKAGQASSPAMKFRSAAIHFEVSVLWVAFFMEQETHIDEAELGLLQSDSSLGTWRRMLPFVASTAR
jgi:hypothetical protein